MDATGKLQAGLASLYPELAGATPDLLEHAESIILRVLNEGGEELQIALLEHYGQERVSEVARKRLHRLTNPTYRRWSNRLNLPPRSASVQRIQALWQP
jgi:hypothetical protein